MKDFLQEHEREVVDMVNFEWNQKDFEEAIREDTFKKATGTEEKELFPRGRRDAYPDVLYWVKEYVDQIMDKLTAFYGKNL